MEILLTGLILGLMGSFHCVGMCGPIALSLPLHGNTYGQKVFGGILYNIGRTTTYGVMGIFFGIIGQGFQMVGFQRWISIAMGTVMILSILIPSLFKKFDSNILDFTSSLRKGIQKLFTQRSFKGLYFIGLLNGLLPCGLVYMAIAGAIGTGDFTSGFLFMVLFGLGTIPMLLIISLLGNLISISVRNKINKLIPYVVVLVGLIFIMRGLALGIPFLSPPEKKLNPTMHMKSETKVVVSSEIEKSCCHADEE